MFDIKFASIEFMKIAFMLLGLVPLVSFSITESDLQKYEEYTRTLDDPTVGPQKKIITKLRMGLMHQEELVRRTYVPVTGEYGPSNFEIAQALFEEVVDQVLCPKAQVAAQRMLGGMYQNGQIGGKRDTDKAQELLEKVSGQSVNLTEKAAADRLLGHMYQRGQIGSIDGEPNMGKAFGYFTLVSVQTYNKQAKALADLSLGKMYQRGQIGSIDGEPNMEKAFEYFTLASEQSDDAWARGKATALIDLIMLPPLDEMDDDE